MGAAKFEVGIGMNNQYVFKLMSADGKPVVESRGYQDKESCYEAVRAIKENALVDQRYERVRDNGKLSFRLKAPNHQVLATAGPFEKEEDLEGAILAVRRSGEAAIIDRS